MDLAGAVRTEARKRPLEDVVVLEPVAEAEPLGTHPSEAAPGVEAEGAEVLLVDAEPDPGKPLREVRASVSLISAAAEPCPWWSGWT